MSTQRFDWIRFKNPPLRLVIAQLQFPILLRFSSQDFIAPFYEAIRQDYPRLVQQEQYMLQISAAGVEPQANKSLWRMATRDNTISVLLSETSLTLEARTYVSAKDFFARFTRVLEAAIEHLNISEKTRLGLRYLNEFRHPDGTNLANWKQLLNPAFIGTSLETIAEGEVLQSLQEQVIQRKDGTLVIRQGYLPGTVVRPAPHESIDISGSFYLLDLDYFDSIEEPLQVGTIIERLVSFNEVMYTIFRWALGTKLYDYLEPIHD